MSVRAPVGPTNVANVKCCIGRGLAAIRCGSQCNSDFILAALRLFEADLAKLGSGSTFSAIKRKDLESLRIPLPPLSEQKRITAILKEQLAAVDKARAAAQARLEAVRALPAAFLRQVFPQPDASLPKGWRWVQLAEIGPLTDGDWILNTDYAPAGVRLLQVGDVGIGQFVGKSSRFVTSERAKELKCTFLEVGDILISRMPRPIGRACQLPPVGHLCITAVDVSIWRPEPRKADRKYLVYYLSSPMWFECAKASASGATRPRISRSNLESLQLPMPPVPEQRRIAGVLEEQLAAVDKARAAAEEELVTVNALPAALLRRAFSGEL